jgi:heme-degrading monooxygenase HmoA
MAEMLTVVEGKIDPGKASILEDEYVTMKRGSRPVGLRMSFLAKGGTDPETFFIYTVWESPEALRKMRESTDVPAAVAAFRKAGAEPRVSMLEIREEIP